MRKATRMTLFFLVLMMTVSAMLFTASAEMTHPYFNVTKNESYTKNGNYYLSFTVKSISSAPGLVLSARLMSPSGESVYAYNGAGIAPGRSRTWGFGYDYSTLPSGTYTLKVNVRDHYDSTQWSASYNIKHTAPTPSFSYKSYETYYNKSGMLMHKINIQCLNMKGKKLYCKIYDSYGNLVTDWGTDTPLRKTNNETGFFSWGGYKDGEKYPSGEYTFVITSSANKKVVQKTLKLNILEVGKS